MNRERSSDANLTGVVALVSGITRGLFDPWLDSIAIVAIRRRNAIKRRNIRLKETAMSSVDRDLAYLETKTELVNTLTAAGPPPLAEIPLKDLAEVHWNLTVMTGILEAEIAERDGLTDMAEQS